MSHTTTVKGVQIRDIKAVRKAVSELQKEGVSCELIENAKPRMYHSNQHGKCDYVLKLNDSKYDVGLEKQEDGSYAPVFDEWASEVYNQIGAKNVEVSGSEQRSKRAIGRFMQKYSVNASINAARKRGYTVLGTTTDKQGNTQVQVQC